MLNAGNRALQHGDIVGVTKHHSHFGEAFWRHERQLKARANRGQTQGDFRVSVLLEITIGSDRKSIDLVCVFEYKLVQENSVNAFTLMRKTHLINILALAGMVSGGTLVARGQTAPPNDYFTNRIALTNLQDSVTADNSLASSEPGEPSIGNYYLGGRTLWWSYTAPQKGALAVFVQAPTFNAAWGVFRGQTLTNLTRAISD
jgi:hypothetical protein